MSPAVSLMLAGSVAAAVALLGAPVRARTSRRGAPGANRWDQRATVLLAAGSTVVVGVGLAVVSGTAVALGVILSASAADLLRRGARRRHQRFLDVRRAQVLAACESLAADVRAGVPPLSALGAAADVWPSLAEVARAARFGGDVPDALLGLGRQQGFERAATIAAAWSVAHRTGAGIATTLELAARTLRADEEVAGEVATEIAAARATAMILALLPVGVLVLGQGIGGASLPFLLGTPAGLCCLGAGLGLAHLGLAWLDAIAAGVRR